MADRRWDTDDRRIGVRDASAFAEPVRRLLETLQRPGWVVEVITGQLPGDGSFATHGHVVRIRTAGGGEPAKTARVLS